MHQLFSLPWIHSPRILGPYGAPNTPDHPAAHPPHFLFVVFYTTDNALRIFALSLAMQYPSTIISDAETTLGPYAKSDPYFTYCEKIRLTTHRISRSPHALGVKSWIMVWMILGVIWWWYISMHIYIQGGYHIPCHNWQHPALHMPGFHENVLSCIEKESEMGVLRTSLLCGMPPSFLLTLHCLWFTIENMQIM